jgi:hypothetical protein
VAPGCLPGREGLRAFPCRWLAACHSVGPTWPGRAGSATAAPRPRWCWAGWRPRRLPSRGLPRWPLPSAGRASQPAGAQHPRLGTVRDTGVACRLWLCWLCPAGRVAAGPPLHQGPAAVACAGCVLPSRPAPCRGLSPPPSTLRATTPPPQAVGCPCDRTPPPAWAWATAGRRFQPWAVSGFPLRCRRSCRPSTDVFPRPERLGLPTCCDASLPACHGLRTPAALHRLALPVGRVLPAGAFKPAASATSHGEAVPALQGARSPLRPPGYAVDASSLLFVVCTTTPPPWTPDALRVGGSPLPDKDFHLARDAKLLLARQRWR